MVFNWEGLAPLINSVLESESLISLSLRFLPSWGPSSSRLLDSMPKRKPSNTSPSFFLFESSLKYSSRLSLIQ